MSQPCPVGGWRSLHETVCECVHMREKGLEAPFEMYACLNCEDHLGEIMIKLLCFL